MVVFPHAKINLGLHITERRPDGYHNIETVFCPVGIYDALEAIPFAGGTTSLEVSGSAGVPAGPENLCLQACRLLEEEHALPPLKIHLHKNIPAGAGLGGGSSDGAFTLKLLNGLFRLGLGQEELAGLARRLGSDCAFFLEGSPAFAFGKGDEFSALELDLSAYCLTVVMPAVQVSTAAAYAGVSPKKPFNSLQMLLRAPVEEWRHTVGNDFEKSVFRKFPVIAAIKEELYRSGAIYASMSGSGAAVYGIFREKTPLPRLEKDCRVFYGVQERER